MVQWHHPKRKHTQRLLGEVMSMDVKTRILAIRLMETMQKDSKYAQMLGIEAALKKKDGALPASISPS